MRCLIDWDELYPSFSLKKSGEGDWEGAYEIELTEAEWEDWCRVDEEYGVWWQRIYKIWREAQSAKRV